MKFVRQEKPEAPDLVRCWAQAEPARALTNLRNIPVLVVHGTEDRIRPYEATAKRLPALVSGVKLVSVEGGPHNIGWTHPEEVNKALLEFLGDGAAGSGALDRDLRAAAAAKTK